MSCRYCTVEDSDWLEVLLTDTCNGKCEWCMERDGWHPSERAGTPEMIAAVIRSQKKHILLLGGEPTLCPDLRYITMVLREVGRTIILTTNGSCLTREYVQKALRNVNQVNISIHAPRLLLNEKITGLPLNGDDLIGAVDELHSLGAKVRLNCNCIRGYVDSAEKIDEYMGFAKTIGVDSVRFAELFGETDLFVDLAKITDCGLTDDPWTNGCVHDTVINGMPVYFKQLCGFQTTARPRPDDDPAKIIRRDVLYYDGKMYKGWQRKEDHVCNTSDDRPVTRTEFNVLMDKLEEIRNDLATLQARSRPAQPDWEGESSAEQRLKDAESMTPFEWGRAHPGIAHPTTRACHY